MGAEWWIQSRAPQHVCPYSEHWLWKSSHLMRNTHLQLKKRTIKFKNEQHFQNIYIFFPCKIPWWIITDFLNRPKWRWIKAVPPRVTSIVIRMSTLRYRGWTAKKTVLPLRSAPGFWLQFVWVSGSKQYSLSTVICL